MLIGKLILTRDRHDMTIERRGICSGVWVRYAPGWLCWLSDAEWRACQP